MNFTNATFILSTFILALTPSFIPAGFINARTACAQSLITSKKVQFMCCVWPVIQIPTFAISWTDAWLIMKKNFCFLYL